MAIDPDNPFLPQAAPVAVTPGANVDPSNPFLQSDSGTLLQKFQTQSIPNQEAIAGNASLNPVEKVIQAVGEGAGFVSKNIYDPVISGVSNFVGKTIPPEVKNAIGSIPANAILDPGGTLALKMAGVQQPTLSDVAQGAGQVAGAVGNAGQQAYNWAEKQNPNLTHDVGAVGQTLATVFTPGIVGDVAAPVLGAGLDAAKVGAKAVGDAMTSPVLTSDALKAEAQKAYQYADQVGGQLSANNLSDYIDKVSGQNQAEGIGKITNSNPQLDNIVDQLQAYKGQPLSLKAAQDYDSGLSKMIDDHVDPVTGKMDSQGHDLYELQTNFRDMLQNAKPEDMQGGDQGFDAWQQAQQLWAKQARQGDIERIVAKANTMQQPANSMRAAFGRLSTSGRMNGYTDAEQAAIQAAAKGNFATDMISTLGSRLVPVIGAAAGGGPAGYVAGSAISGAARNVANVFQTGRATKVMQLISKDGKFIPPEAAAAAPVADTAPAAPLMLPAPVPDTIVDSSGAARPATMDEQQTMNAQRDARAQLGLTPDVQQVISQNDLRAKIGPDWDKLDAATQKQVEDQVNQAWALHNQNSVQDAIQGATDQAGITGNNSPFLAAFQKAQSEFNARKALQGVAK